MEKISVIILLKFVYNPDDVRLLHQKQIVAQFFDRLIMFFFLTYFSQRINSKDQLPVSFE